MRWCATVALLCFPVAAMAGAGGGQEKAATEPPPVFDKAYLSDPKNIAAGEKVWEGQCRHCHGSAAYPGKAPKLRPSQLLADFIFDRVTNGFKGMPSWKAVFTYEERKAVVAYVKSDDFSP